MSKITLQKKVYLVFVLRINASVSIGFVKKFCSYRGSGILFWGVLSYPGGKGGLVLGGEAMSGVFMSYLCTNRW